MVATIILARYTKNFLPRHVTAMKRIMRYLKGVKEKGLTFKRISSKIPNTIELESFSDADWGADVITRRSLSGCATRLWGSFVNCYCKTQSIVALSTAESELMAATEACKDLKYILNLCSALSDIFEIKVSLPVTIRVDNIAAIFIGENRVNNQRTRHIDMRFMRVRELVVEGTVKLIHVSSELNIADLFTKPLPFDSFVRHRLSICNF